MALSDQLTTLITARIADCDARKAALDARNLALQGFIDTNVATMHLVNARRQQLVSWLPLAAGIATPAQVIPDNSDLPAAQ